jgi:hypothetical protein
MLSATIALAGLPISSAFADRTGHAPVNAPKAINSHHVEFNLPGGGWSQVVGALAGTPALGRYARDVTLEQGATCHTGADVVATATRRYPSIGERTVRLRPGSARNTLLRVSHRGKSGRFTWWAGSLGRWSDAAAGAVRALPPSLRTGKRRWLVIEFSVPRTSLPEATAPCARYARATAGRLARTVARSLKLAAGASKVTGPFSPA